MSLLPESALISDPLDERKREEQENLYKSATQAYDDVVGKPIRGLQGPSVQVADASGGMSSWREQLATLNKATPAQQAVAPSSEAMGWRAQLSSLNAPPPPEQSNFSRGVSVSGKQLKQTAYGTAALIGDTFGSDSLKDWGLKGYQDAEKEVKAISKESDSFTTAFEKGEMGKWLSYSSGYLIGQVAEMGAASLAGAALGTLAAPGGGTVAGAVAGAVEKGAVQAGVKSFVGKMIDKQIAANVARGMAEEAAASAAVKSVYGKIGATTANTFLNATQELGSIYGDAVEQAALTGKEYSLGKVWLSGIAATAVDSWADSVGLGKLVGAVGGDKAIRGVAMEALKGGFREGMTEGVQTAIERWGANKDTTSKEAFREYIDSAAVGILGGSVSGGASGALNKITSGDSKTDKGGAAPGESSELSSTGDKSQPQISAPVGIEKKELLRTIQNMDAMAYLYDKGTPEEKANIEKAVQRANLIEEFNAAKGNVDAIRAGEAQLAGEPMFVDALRNALDTFANTLPQGGAVKMAPRVNEPPPSQFDQDTTEAKPQKPLERVAALLRGDKTLGEDMRNDPLVARLVAYSALVFKNEKVSDPRTWTPEESAAYQQGSEAFSKVRGYTDEQIQQYKTYQDLIRQVQEKYGQDAIFDVENPFVQQAAFDVIYGKGAYAAQEKLHNDAKIKVDLEERRKEHLDMLQTADDGIRFSRTQKKVTVSDLPDALTKVMSALANTGIHNFVDMSTEVMKRMRASEGWRDMAKNVTPAMLRNAYNQLDFAEKQTPEQVASVTTKQLRDAVAAAVKPAETLDASQEAKQVDLQILNENRTLEKELDPNWSKQSMPASEVPAALAGITPDAEAAFDRLEGLKTRQKELLEEQREEAKHAKPTPGETTDQTSDEELLDTYFVAGKPQKPNRKPLPAAKVTPAIRRALSKMSAANQKEALLALGEKTDEELAKTEANLIKFEENQAKREAEKQKGKNLELDVETSQPTLIAEKFAKKVSDLLAMRNETKFFRDTLKQMQDALTELDKSLRRSKTIREDGKTFKAVDLTDEHAYLWSEGQGFNIPKNLPEEKVLELRRKLVDQIREMQQQSIKGQADLFKNSIARLDYQLSLLRNEALRDGIPQDAVDRVYTPARELLVNMRNELNGKPEGTRVSEEAESAISDAIQGDFFEQDLAARKLVEAVAGVRMLEQRLSKQVSAGMLTQKQADAMLAAYKAEQKEDRLSPVDAVKSAMQGMRDGSFTFGDLMRVFRESGTDVPLQLYSVSGHLALQTRMLDHVKANGFSTGARLNWLRSMDSAIARVPGLLEGNTFTDGEKLQYEQWKEDRQKIADRRKVDEVMQYSNDVEEAFPGLLFNDYTLARLRGEDSIPAAKLAALKDTVGELEQAWFQDVAFALHTRPDLRNQIEAAIKPDEMAEFRDWLVTKERAVEKEAEILAKLPYFQALRAMPGFDPDLTSTPEKADGTRDSKLSMYEKFYAEIANAQILGLDRIIANAERIGDAVRTSQTDSRNLEARLSEFMDDSVLQDQLEAGEYELEIDGSMGRDVGAINSDESVEDLANEDAGFDFQDEYGDDVDELRMRRGFFGGVLTAAQVQAHVARLTAGWKTAPQIEVIQNAAMLPEPLRSRVIERLGPNMGAKGLFDSETGMVYLFSDMLAGDADTEFTLFHEVYGHLGLRAFLGAKFDSFLKNMYNAYPRIKAEVDAVMESEGLPLLEAIDEVISDFAGKGQQIPAVKAWIGKIIAGLRSLGFERVANWMAKQTNAELAYYLKGAQETAKNGGYNVFDGAPGAIRLAEERMPYELFSLKGDTTAAYARFNPITQTWSVFKATGDDIRNGYTAVVMDEYTDVLEFMRKAGYVERRKRSGAFVDDKLPGDMPKLASVTDITGMKRWMRDMITRYQNEYKPVFDVVDYLKAQGRLTDRMDIKTALLLYERKTGAVIEHFRRHYVEPLMKLVEEAKGQGADYETINKFLLARHAEDRNKQIARVNPKYPDGGSGMTTQKAKDYLKSLESNPAFDTLQEIGRMTDKMSDQKLKYQVNTGMITIKQANAQRAAYKHYVNLSGLKEGLDGFDDPSRLAGGGSKFNVKGKEQRAMGRESEATDILARTILGMEAALIRGQKNMVAQRVLALVEANYDPNFAVVNEIAYKKMIGEDGMVTEQEDPEYIRRKDVMVAKVNGIPVTIRFKDTDRGSFADAIHGMVYPPDSSPWLARLGSFNQVLGQMLTTWNPAWVAVNFARDVQTMYFNAASDGRITKAQAAQMVKTLPAAIKTALYMASNGKLNINVDPEMVRIYNEMKQSGGLTSFLNRKDLEGQVNEIHQMLGERSKLQKVGDRFKGVLDLMEYMTLPMEIAPRLAAYKVVRDNGFTAEQSAVFSGEITVNFNMRGSVKEMRQLFLFFNPAVQGSAKMVSLARNNPGRLTGYAFAFAGLGAMANLIARAAGDDDEAGRNDLDKVPTYKRATSLVIKPNMPGGAIPIPYGWNAFYAFGHFMMDSILGVQPLDVTAKRIAKTAFEAYTPLGTAGLDSKSMVGTVLKGVSPTATLPIVEWVMNENRYGAPIRKEGDQFGGAVLPDSQMAFRSVSPISKSIAESLNEVTGGNRYKAGAIDVNPAAIDFIIGSYAPGLVNEVYKGASMGARIARGEDVKNTPMPLVDRFTAKTPEGFDAGAFRRAKEMTETRYNEYKNMPELRDEIRKELPGLMRAHAIVASTTQEIRDLRAKLAKIEKNESISEADKVDRLNRTRERETALYNRAVKAVMDAGPEFKNAVMASD